MSTATSGTTEASTAFTNACAVCQAPATKRCSRCKTVWYCTVDHQRSHWKAHKADCNDSFQADQYTLHKREFDRIVKTNRLDTEEASEAISTYLTTTEQVTPADFAKKFNIKVEEAVVFLEWIKVGMKFKQESIDAAKNSGFK